MKKIIVLLGILALPFVAFGATKVITDGVTALRWTDYVAQIESSNQGNIFIYRVEDKGNTCYVAYTSGHTNGNNTNISCVNSVK